MRLLPASLIAGAIGLFAWNSSPNWTKAPHEMGPTRLSLLIQTHFPSMYEPPLLVFVSRYGHGVNDTHRTSIVVGPDCRRVGVMVRNDPAGADLPPVTGTRTQYCEAPINPERLVQLVREKLKANGDKGTYIYLTDTEFADLVA